MFKKVLTMTLVIAIIIINVDAKSIQVKADSETTTVDSSKNRVSIKGTEFRVDGKRIWFNGVNTPWGGDNGSGGWNEFAGKINSSWWDNHFAKLHESGINASRVWITCSGEAGIQINEDGKVTGVDSKMWDNLDELFRIAKKHKIYIMATLISFDHFKDSNTTYQRWRNMINSDDNIDSMVENYVIPFVNRYKENPYLFSIDLCNEPDWVYEQYKISWDRLQQYFAKSAAAIHENSKVLVTVGMAMVKYNSDIKEPQFEGNKLSDKALQDIANNKLAYLDFYSPHSYDWMLQYWGNPFEQKPKDYGLDGKKPALIGECPANSLGGKSLYTNYKNGYKNGWQGGMAWTSNGVDSNGGLKQVTKAAKAFAKAYPKVIVTK